MSLCCFSLENLILVHFGTVAMGRFQAVSTLCLTLVGYRIYSCVSSMPQPISDISICNVKSVVVNMISDYGEYM